MISTTLPPAYHSLGTEVDTTYPLQAWSLNASPTALNHPINDVQSEILKIENSHNPLKNTTYSFTDILDNCHLEFHFTSNNDNIKTLAKDIDKKAICQFTK